MCNCAQLGGEVALHNHAYHETRDFTLRPGGIIDQSVAARRPQIGRIALLGNHVPRQCGIATFTADLSEAISGEAPDLEVLVAAMNDGGRQYAYPSTVRLQIAEAELPEYLRAADFLNVNDIEILCLQHEYGIFGGKAGSHILTLLRELRMPVVTTLHTILEAPSPAQRSVMNELLQLSERVIVMSAKGASLLGVGH